MTIRTRLTLWYAVIFSVSLLVIGVSMYSELVVEQRAKIARHHQASVDDDAGEDITQILVFYGGSAVVVGLLGGWWITRKALAPVTALTQAAEKIHERNLSEQLPRSGNGDELDRLTEVFNAMTARLDGSFQRIREFTLHASHELKTPLTILRGELETALHDEHSSATQKERLASQIDEIERLTKIVDGLTLLTKADAGQIALKCEPVRLDELVRESFADAKILASPQSIEVQLDTCEQMTVAGDRHRLRQLLLNLADNAVKYNRPGGTVTISLRRDGTSAGMQISNTGAGLSPALQPRVFERFFRGDTSHNSAVEGCGLGLSIAQWIVTAHRGEIRFSSEPDKLTTVSVRLPLA
jgi:signal transduction histidine kinase